MSLSGPHVAKAAGDFRMELRIPDGTFGTVVVRRNIRIVEEGKDLLAMLPQSLPQFL